MFFSDLLYYSHCLATLSLLSLLLSLHKSSTSFFSSFPTLFCSSSSLYCHTVPPSSSTQCQFFRSFSLFPLFLICVLSVLSFSLTPPLSLSFSSSVSMSCCRVLESGSVTGNRVPWDLCTLLLRSENCLHNMKGELHVLMSYFTVKALDACVCVCMCVCVCVCVCVGTGDWGL